MAVNGLAERVTWAPRLADYWTTYWTIYWTTYWTTSWTTSYWTTSVNVAVCTCDPMVAVTVTVLVPAGVCDVD